MEETRDLETTSLETTALDRDAAELHEVIIRLGWISRRRLEQELDTFGITVPQFIALRCIRDNEAGCSMTHLAESSQQVSATMTGIVDRLVEGGLVQRVRDPADRRALRVVMTPQGRALVERVSEHQRGWMRRFLVELDHEERRSMIAMARRYLEVVENTVV